MIASAFQDIWSPVIFLKFSELHEPQKFKNITRAHILRNAPVFIRFSILIYSR